MLLNLPPTYQSLNAKVRAWFLSQSQAVPAPPPRVAAPLCRLRVALLVGDGGGTLTLTLARYGWASLQRDGGVRSVEAKVRPYLLPAYLLGNDTRNTCC